MLDICGPPSGCDFSKVIWAPVKYQNNTDLTGQAGLTEFTGYY